MSYSTTANLFTILMAFTNAAAGLYQAVHVMN